MVRLMQSVEVVTTSSLELQELIPFLHLVVLVLRPLVLTPLPEVVYRVWYHAVLPARKLNLISFFSSWRSGVESLRLRAYFRV